ncbi:MAG TPA: hypothetical protein VMW27_13905 [Thermoanaerobaculia bacterium]|nr:hypothetical protein [Thermoanaerobaculia bacterium]
MSQGKIRQILAGLVLVTVLTAVPGSAEAGGFVPRRGTSFWSMAAQWLVEHWDKVGQTLGRPLQHEDRVRSRDKKGSSLDPNG